MTKRLLKSAARLGLAIFSTNPPISRAWRNARQIISKRSRHFSTGASQPIRGAEIL
jgi:hypothetical protein